MTTYLGARGFGEAGVFVKRRRHERYAALDPRTDLREFSRAGFSWGSYTVPNCRLVLPGEQTQLALAILADHLGPAGEAEALALAPAFAAVTIARLPAGSWTLETADIEEAVALLRDDPLGFTP